VDSFIHVGDHRFQVDLNSPNDISIPVDFEGDQLNYFNVQDPKSRPYKTENIKGSTLLGGGCNFDIVSIIPHCHTTHTECVGHIVDESILINSFALNGLKSAYVISVTPESGLGKKEKLSDYHCSTDKVITGGMMENKIGDLDFPVEVLVVRTLPNSNEKLTMKYNRKNIPPYFSLSAIEVIKKLNIIHLCMDLPSLDRAIDGGSLAGHHLFWDIPMNTHSLSQKTPSTSTITELIFVPNEIKDGIYFINLQVANLSLDASFSRPVLYPIIT
jgi:kynurenine formamidase